MRIVTDGDKMKKLMYKKKAELVRKTLRDEDLITKLRYTIIERDDTIEKLKEELDAFKSDKKFLDERARAAELEMEIGRLKDEVCMWRNM